MVAVTNLEQMVPCAAGIVLGTRYYQDRIFDPNKGADTDTKQALLALPSVMFSCLSHYTGN